MLRGKLVTKLVSSIGNTHFVDSLVAELRLCGLIIARIDQFDLVERVMRQLRELQE